MTRNGTVTLIDLPLKSIRQYRKSFHDHDPRVHLQPGFVPELSEVRLPTAVPVCPQVLISILTIARRTPRLGKGAHAGYASYATAVG